MICGKQGDLSFANVSRPNLENQRPSGYQACSTNTEAENTICYADDTDMTATCPITDILFVLTLDLDTYIAKGYQTVWVFNDTTTLIYFTDFNSLQITSTAIQY